MRRPWTETEYQILDDIIGSYPFSEVPKKFQAIAKSKGLLPRTATAISVKAKREFSSVKATDKNFTYTFLARLLKISRWRVREWVRSDKLKAKQAGRYNMTKISPQALNEFAATYPHLLSDGDHDALTYLLGEDTADHIKSLPSSKSQPMPIKHLPTGKIYPSLRKAAQATFYNKKSIRDKIGKGEWEIVA